MAIARADIIQVRNCIRNNNFLKARDFLTRRKLTHDTLVQLLPKVELHYHLDGAVRPETIFDESVKQEIDLRQVSQRLPVGYTVDDIRRVTSMQEGEKITDFMAFLTDKFFLPLAVMQTRTSLERIAYEATEDGFADGLFHREIIFAPCLHTRNGLSYNLIMDSILSGLRRGANEFGISSSLRPSIYRNMVDDPEFADHPLKTVEAAIRARDTYNDDIRIALDLVGHEAPYPPSDERYKAAFDLAIGQKLLMSIHAGEQPGTAGNVFYAFDNLDVRRIGHGIDVMTLDLSPDQIGQLKKCTFELCPSSNVMLGNTSGGFEGYPLMKMLELGLRPTVSTDDATVFGTTLTNEFLRLEEMPGFKVFENGQVSDVYKRLQENALTGAFMTRWRKQHLREEFQSHYDFIKSLI